MEPLDGPAGCILECLVLDSGELVPELAAPIFYLLGALAGEQLEEGLVRDRKGGQGSILGILEPSLSPDLSPELVRGHGLGDAMGPWVHQGRLTQAGAASLGLKLQAASITSYSPLLVGEARLGTEHPVAGAEFCVPAHRAPWGLLG